MKEKPGTIRILSSLALLLFLAGCAIPSPMERQATADQAAGAVGWKRVVLRTDVFDLTGYLPAEDPVPSNLLTVYIEGDGLAWINRSLISPDPTPVKPVGLLLATQHPDQNVAYLARACQYGQSRNCRNYYWTSGRFSPELIDSFSQAINQLKKGYQANQVQLIGYSGGGAIAALVAAQRDDIARLVTVAGNLDHTAWSDEHSISPLNGSMNPAESWQALLSTPQIHFVGAEDEVISPGIVKSFAGRFPVDKKPDIRIIPGMNHNCCWEAAWPQLYTGQTINDRGLARH